MSNENKIRILYVQPGKYPEERFVSNELHPLQQLVAGYMQAVYPWSKDKVALVCNDSGKVDGLPLNRCIEDYDVIAGNFFLCGFSGEEFCSLTDEQFRRYEKLFRDPELFLPTPIGIMPMKCTPDQYKRLMQERSAANRGERWTMEYKRKRLIRAALQKAEAAFRGNAPQSACPVRWDCCCRWRVVLAAAGAYLYILPLRGGGCLRQCRASRHGHSRAGGNTHLGCPQRHGAGQRLERQLRQSGSAGQRRGLVHTLCPYDANCRYRR